MSKKSQETSDTPPVSDQFVDSMVEVVEATLQVGASIARTVADATAGEKGVAEPKEDSGPIAAMVHYGSAAVANVVSTVAGRVDLSRRGEDESEAGSATAAGRPATVPAVVRGSTLRIPLVIENPGDEPMEGMTFSCLELSGEKSGPGKKLPKKALRLEPLLLTVAPRDFEKLTVFVDTANDTAPGRYVGVVGVGADMFEVSVHFDVIAKESG